jgi:hypothetical protein
MTDPFRYTTGNLATGDSATVVKPEHSGYERQEAARARSLKVLDVRPVCEAACRHDASYSGLNRIVWALRLAHEEAERAMVLSEKLAYGDAPWS